MRTTAVIIDDEPWTRKVIQSLGEWEALGIELVGEASDGETGLELVHQVMPDIVITDVRMPRLNGIDLIALLRREHNTAQVLVISGYDDYAYIRSALQLDVTDYLLKPIKPDELNRQLQRCKERMHTPQSMPEQTVSIGFWAKGWEPECEELFGRIKSALRGSDCPAALAGVEALRKKLAMHVGRAPARGVLIGCYYALISQLQQYIEDAGYTVLSLFGDRETNFVFSHESTAEDLFAFVAALYRDAMSAVAARGSERGKLDIGAIRRYVDAHYTESITLEETARQFFVSKEYLSKLFKQTFGIGFAEHLTALRMQQAKELLACESLSLKEIGAKVGYYDQAHFYKTFHKFYGITPGEMRQALKTDKTDHAFGK